MVAKKLTRLIYKEPCLSLNQRNKLGLTTIFNVIYEKLCPPEKPPPLGRWATDKCNSTLERSQYLSNLDNCGMTRWNEK